jgi:hypothetical protein
MKWSFQTPASWGTYSTAAYPAISFLSKPTCTLRELHASHEDGIVVAGKGTNNRIYTSAGRAGSNGLPPANPVPLQAWTTLNNTVYNTGGEPALASNTHAVVLVYMGNSLRTIGAYRRNIPYLSNSWALITNPAGPTLPLNWAVVGAPTVTKAAAPNLFSIVVLAYNSATTTYRLFRTHLYAAGASGANHFSDATGSPNPTWTEMASLMPSQAPNLPDSEPALTFHPQHGYTIYFRRGTQIMQTSHLELPKLGQNPLLAVEPAAGIAYDGAPAAWVNPGYEVNVGSHDVIARTLPPSAAVPSDLWRATTEVDDGMVP